MAAPVNAVELIKDRLDIVQALTIYAGADFSRASLNREKTSIKCPFHADSSPSMTVFLTDNRFRCWAGCNEGRHGDIIDVVRLGYNLSTADAIKQLRMDLITDGSALDRKTVTRITEKRREIDKIKVEREALKWATDSLQWLCREIPRQSGNIKTDAGLEAWSPLIYLHAEIEYKLDCLLGIEYAKESDKTEIIRWTQELMEGVRRHYGVGKSGETAFCKIG